MNGISAAFTGRLGKDAEVRTTNTQEKMTDSHEKRRR
jgi:hypothetical protein